MDAETTIMRSQAQKILVAQGDKDAAAHIEQLDLRALVHYAYDRAGTEGKDAMDHLRDALDAYLAGTLRAVEITSIQPGRGIDPDKINELYGTMRITGQTIWHKTDDWYVSVPHNEPIPVKHRTFYTITPTTPLSADIWDYNPMIFDADRQVMCMNETAFTLTPGYGTPSISVSVTALNPIATDAVISIERHGENAGVTFTKKGFEADARYIVTIDGTYSAEIHKGILYYGNGTITNADGTITAYDRVSPRAAECMKSAFTSPQEAPESPPPECGY